MFCQSIFFGKLKLDDVQISLPPLAWGQLLRISGYGVIIEEVLFFFFCVGCFVVVDVLEINRI